MAPERRRQIALAVLVIALAAVVYQQFSAPPAVPSASPSNRVTARNAGQRAGAPAEVPDVRLEDLEQERPKPGGSSRNLFRFRQQPPPTRPAPVAPPPSARQNPVPVPLPSTGVAPIPLRFIGFVQAQGKDKIVALADDRGVYHGREGTIIEGRYRIVQVGVESVVLEYVDGQGRQTIPLSNRQ